MLYLMGVMLGVAVVLVYIVTSVVLLRFPSLMHKKKRQSFTCRHISHRGGELRACGCVPSHLGGVSREGVVVPGD